MLRSQSTVRAIGSPDVPEPPPGLFSNCLVVDNVVYISGQHAGTPNGPVGADSVLEQSREALRRVLALLRAAGGSAKDVVKLTIYLCDMNRKSEVSRARMEVFSDPLPCSTLVGVNALVDRGLLVEFDAVAVLTSGRGCTGADCVRAGVSTPGDRA
jgi:enamine deaminase RidA (YjgF/YER057c/UK114 family)